MSKNFKFQLKQKFAFTLAEVLITLGVIGIVAAITMPTVIANINERVNSERQANIAQKITQAMEQMRAHGLLNTKYASTDAFVDELQKYLKIAKRCDSSHIADCWPTETVTTSDGEEFEVSKAKTGINLNHKNNKTCNVGLVLADGASLIMTYDENGDNTLDVGSEVRASRTQLPVGGGKLKDFPYTTSVTGAIDFVMDVNGGKGPNSEKINGKWHDIRSFNTAQFSKGCAGKKFDGIGCVVVTDTSYDWEGAKKACSDMDMTLADNNTIINVCFQSPLGDKYKGGYFWSIEEDPYASNKAFRLGGSGGCSGTTSYKSNFSYYPAMCVSE